MDLQSVCRLCSLKLHKPRNIFTTPGLRDKISTFTGIQIRNGDGLPCSICDLCDITLQITEEFRHQVGRADELIRALALKQNTEFQLNKSGISATAKRAPGQNGVPKTPENGNHGFRPHQNRRGEICRERMRSSDRRRSWHTNLWRNAKSENKIMKNSLTYSYETAKSLVASYKALINRCQAEGFPEEFALPSYISQSDTESELEMDERATRFAAARRRNAEKFIAENIALRSVTRSVPNFGNGSPEHDIQDAISPQVPIDPLNLLRVKSVRPLVGEVGDLSSPDSSRGPCIFRIESCENGTPRHSEVDEDLEEQSSTEGSNFGVNFRLSGSSSSSSTSTENIATRWPRRAPVSPPSKGSAENRADATRTSKNRQLGTQCPICDRIVLNIRGLKVHMKIHRAEKCQICQAPTATNKKFRDHMQLHVRPMEPGTTFKCLVCKNLFMTNIGLNAHMRNHTLSVPAITECPHCKRSFGTMHGYRIHLAKSHKGFES